MSFVNNSSVNNCMSVFLPHLKLIKMFIQAILKWILSNANLNAVLSFISGKNIKEDNSSFCDVLLGNNLFSHLSRHLISANFNFFEKTFPFIFIKDYSFWVIQNICNPSSICSLFTGPMEVPYSECRLYFNQTFIACSSS